MKIWLVLLLTFLNFHAVQAEEGSKTARVGVLLPSPPEPAAGRLKAFIEGMTEHGFVEGRNVSFDIRYAPVAKQQAEFAAQLVAIPVDVILTSATGPTLAAKKATATIPIVFAIAADAVATGLVASFERPGGNVTGVPDSGPDMAGMRLMVLKEAMPGLARVAVIANSRPKQQAAAKRSLEVTAQKLGIELLFPDVDSATDFPAAFEAANTWRADAYVTMSQSLTSNEQGQIVELAGKGGRPLMLHRFEGVEAGALMSLADDPNAIFRSAAGYVAKILNGASPATMTVVPAENAEFVINLRTAKSFGLTIPDAMIKRATRVIQ